MSAKQRNYPLISDLGGSVKYLRRLPDPEDKRWSALNPSIGASPRGYAVAIRSSNYIINTTNGALTVVTPGLVKNRMWFCELAEDMSLNLETLGEISFSSGKYDLEFKRGCEDPKLFWRDDSWYFTAVILERTIPIARIGLFKLDGYSAELIELFEYSWMQPKRVEKNWMVPYEPSPYFDYIYGPNVVIKNGDIQIVEEPADELKSVRGGGNLWKMPDGGYLAVCHRMYPTSIRFWDHQTFSVRDSTLRNYTHMLVKYDERGRITHITEEFQFLGSGIEYAAGIIVKDEIVYISFGSKDVSSHLAELPLADALTLLKAVDR